MVGWAVLEKRREPNFQALVDRSPQALRYFSDAFDVYAQLIYDPGQYQACSDKRETFSVEADNAELRHYLARAGPQVALLFALHRSVAPRAQAVCLCMESSSTPSARLP
ncbi:MAG: hypothetical protein LC737_02225 [Chloroflexi bacterium]|nr:hypothetical protein [Chloroflexota bacterium]